MGTIIFVLLMTGIALLILLKGGKVIAAINEPKLKKAKAYEEHAKTESGGTKRSYEQSASDLRANVLPPLHNFVAAGVFALGLFVLAMNSWTIVEPGHVKVQVLLGSVRDEPLTEGFNVINPMLDLTDYSIQDFTDDIMRIEVPAQDKLKSMMDLSITMAINPSMTPMMYQTAGTANVAYTKYVTPKVRSLLREAGKTVPLSQDFFKDEVQQRLQSELMVSLEEYLAPKGFIIKAVMIRDIDLPSLIKKAIEATKERQEEIQQEKAKLDKAEQTALVQVKQAEAANIAADQNAEAKKKMADAIAYEKYEVAKAVARGNNLINKSLTGQLIEYKKAERWDGILPRWMGVGATPMIDVSKAPR